MSDPFEESLKQLYKAGNGEDFKNWLFEAGFHTHTQEQLDRFRKAVAEVRPRVFELDPSFKEEVDKRQVSIGEDMEARNISVRTQAEAGVKEALAKAEKRVEDERLQEWVERKKFKKRALKDTKEAEPFFCPICGDGDRGNTVNGVPACLKCNHRLVPKSKLKNYNREYKRKHLRRRKTK